MEKNTSKRSAIVHKIAAGAAFAIAAVFLCYAPALRAQADWDVEVDSSFIVTEGLQDPPNCTVNLIDFWAKNNGSLTQTTPDQYNDESTDNGSYGINSGHYLTFGAQTGAWNAWTNNADGSSTAFSNFGLDGNGKAYRGIVNYNLGGGSILR